MHMGCKVLVAINKISLSWDFKLLVSNLITYSFQMGKSTLKNWFAELRHTRSSTRDATRSGRLISHPLNSPDLVPITISQTQAVPYVKWSCWKWVRESLEALKHPLSKSLRICWFMLYFIWRPKDFPINIQV